MSDFSTRLCVYIIVIFNTLKSASLKSSNILSTKQKEIPVGELYGELLHWLCWFVCEPDMHEGDFLPPLQQFSTNVMRFLNLTWQFVSVCVLVPVHDEIKFQPEDLCVSHVGVMPPLELSPVK